MEYSEALGLQRAVAPARIAGAIDQDVLLLVEHPHVVTSGRASKDATFVASPALLEARGERLFEVKRGGMCAERNAGFTCVWVDGRAFVQLFWLLAVVVSLEWLEEHAAPFGARVGT